MILRFCFLLLAFPVCSDAQWRGVLFERFSANEGLNSEDIRAIVQDSTGYMYFGGYQQLIRYDGHTFEDFTHDPENTSSIGPGQIAQIILARDGMLCIAMRRDGLNIFDPKTETFRRYEVPAPANFVGPIVEDEHGNLWLGGDDFAFMHFDRATEKFTTYRPGIDVFPAGHKVAVTGIVQDHVERDIFWISTFAYDVPAYPGKSAYSLVRFDRRTGSFTVKPCAGNLMLQDQQGRLWSGSWSSGLWRYNPSTHQCENMRFEIRLDNGMHPGDGVFAIYPMNGMYWVGSRNSILSVTNELAHTFILQDADNGGISSFFTDASGNTWVGTSKGLQVVHPGSQHIEFFSLSMFGSSERIYPGRLTYHKGENTIFLTTRSEHRLYRIPLDRNQKPDFIPAPFPLTAIVSDRSGRIYVEGGGAIHLFHPRSGKFESVMRTFPGGNDIPWLWSMSMGETGVVAGLGSNDFFWSGNIMDSVRHMKHMGKPGASAYSNMFHSKNGHMILSGGSLMYDIDPSTGQMSEMVAKDHGHLVQDHEGLYWLGTINHIGRYRKEGDSLVLVRYFTVKDGLQNITASQLHVDRHGRIWIFSNQGMSVIDPATYQTRNIGVSEGLPVNACDPVQVIDLPDGRISTVNSNGIILFHPDSLWKATSEEDIHVVLKTVRISGSDTVLEKYVNIPDQLDLLFNQHTLDIQFQGLAFPTDRHVVYSYQVEGLHKEWVFSGKNNMVTLSKLPPGKYIFRVKAALPEVTAPVKEFRFTIGTPIYLQVWFLVLCGLIFLGSMFFLYRYRVAQVRRQEEEKSRVLQQMGELELQALRAQMNPHFMFNSLNSIKNYILKNESALAAEYLSSFAHLIRLILQHSREKTITLKEELEVLLLYIDLEKLRFRNGFEFTCKVDDTIDTTHVQLPPMIIQPFVENAIWHGLLHKEADRHLAIRIGIEDEGVICEVEDNGIGRKQAAAIKSKSATRYKSMGMGITQDRITLMNSMTAVGIHVQVIDKSNGTGKPEGTLVQIHIPYARHTD